MLVVLLILTFYRISLSTPSKFFWWMVNVVHFNYDGIDIGQKTVLFLDIITYAAGHLGDCLHKRRTEDLGGTQSIQKNIKL